jgi:ABC-2 type transport system ATP-binding protein
MIRVNQLVRLFGPIRAVDGVSFEVSEGEVVGFLGPNGAGKTTTMRILTGFIPPTSGQAIVAGHDVVEDPLEARRHLGYLPENVPLYGEMRVREYLDYRARLKGVPRSERYRRLGYVIERCGLQEVQFQLCGTLSKGYRQRVGLADALIHDPEILILDEPTVGLDPIQVRETRQLIKELGTDHTILLSTHILPEVEMVCQRVLIIHRGRIALDEDLSRLQQGSVIEVEVVADGVPTEQVAHVLRDIHGVRDVSVPRGIEARGMFLLQTVDGTDVRERVAERVFKNGWRLRHLAMRRPTLEDRFVEAVLRVES